jgi:hypothetical protein
VQRFFVREVIPTSQFLVEVPLGLGSAVVRDLLVRVPVWFVTEFPSGLALAARWALTQLLVLVVAMFDRVQGLVQGLINAALLIYDSLYGGLRWLVVAAIFHFAPWIFDLAISLAENGLSLVHSAFLLAVAFRLWLWQGLLSLPRLMTSMATWVVESLANVLQVVINLTREAISALYSIATRLHAWIPVFVHQLPHLVLALGIALKDGALYVLSTLGDALLAILEALERAIFSLARGVWNLLWFLLVTLPQRIAVWAWQSLVSLLRLLFIELPRLVWESLVYLIVKLPQRIVSVIIIAVKDTEQFFYSALRQLARPVSTVLTWVLAVAISPFYLVWHLFESGKHGGPGSPSAGVRS